VKILYPRWVLLERIRDLAFTHIKRAYGCDLPLFVVVMNGAKPFADELLSHFESPDVVQIRCRSYVGTQSQTLEVEELPIEQRARFWGREVLILEDIVDTGKTMIGLFAELKEWGAKDVRAVALLRRFSAPRLRAILATGFTVPNDAFVIGFGLDYNGQHRELPDIRKLEKP